MALISCPECTNEISDSAETCPKCGFRLKPPQPNLVPTRYIPVSNGPLKGNGSYKSWSTVILLLVGVLIVFSIFVSLFKNDTGSSSAKTKVNEKIWYAGGTLHNGTLEDWRNASFDNKLATCADWAANAKKVYGESYGSDFEEALRKDAMEIKACVDEVALEPTINMKLNDIAAACIVMIKK